MHLESSGGWAKGFPLRNPHGRPGQSSWLPVSAWSSSGCQSYWDLSLSSPSPCLLVLTFSLPNTHRLLHYDFNQLFPWSWCITHSCKISVSTERNTRSHLMRLIYRILCNSETHACGTLFTSILVHENQCPLTYSWDSLQEPSHR